MQWRFAIIKRIDEWVAGFATVVPGGVITAVESEPGRLRISQKRSAVISGECPTVVLAEFVGPRRETILSVTAEQHGIKEKPHG